MSATLADIFVDEGCPRSEEAQSSWDVYDLWTNRTSNRVANAIIKAISMSAANTTSVYWNATAQSYFEGVAAGEPVLLGQYAEIVEAGGSVEGLVESHGMLAVRLRRREAGLKRKRDEL